MRSLQQFLHGTARLRAMKSDALDQSEFAHQLFERASQRSVANHVIVKWNPLFLESCERPNHEFVPFDFDHPRDGHYSQWLALGPASRPKIEFSRIKAHRQQ